MKELFEHLLSSHTLSNFTIDNFLLLKKKKMINYQLSRQTKHSGE